MLAFNIHLACHVSLLICCAHLPLPSSFVPHVTCHFTSHLCIIPYSFFSLFSHLLSLTPCFSYAHFSPSSHPLLLHFHRDCNAKMSYQLLYPDQTDPKLIKMEMDGTIHTTNISGHAVVVVTAFESESDYNHEIDGSRDYNQSVVVHVEVRPVASLALTPPPFLPKAMPSSRYYSFTLGFTAHFTFDLHDIKGRMFSRTAKSIQYRLNR